MQTRPTRTLGELLRFQAVTRGEAPFVHFGAETVSFAEMDRLATRAAMGFAALGVSHGARVCIALPNGIDFLTAWFGLARLGAVEVPINLEFKGDQVRYVVQDAAAEVLIAEPAFFDSHAECLAECDTLRTVILAGDAPAGFDGTRFSASLFREVLRAEYDLGRLAPVRPSDPFAILYTSGTTGSPKGVLLCHEHEISLGESIARSIDLKDSDCFYNFFPMHHNTAQGIITCSTLASGARMLLTSRFSRTRFWDDVKDFGCTVFYGMGAILEILNKDPDGPAAADGHSLRVGWGIAMGVEQVKRFTELFGVPFVTGYGSTEISMAAMMTAGDGPAGMVGKELDDFEIAIVDGSDLPVADGQVGEIVVRPKRPFITFLEYWNKPRETVQAWRNLWIHTGDAGYLDRDRNLYFVDRIKDVIRHRGNNISSVEVENVLLEFAAVQEAAVVPAPSELGDYEQEVRAMLVLAEGRRLYAQDLIDHCAEKLPYYAVPRYVDILESFPKTSTGKIRKAELRDAEILPTTWDLASSGKIVRSRKTQTTGG